MKGNTDMKTLTAIPIAELIKKAGSEKSLAELAGIRDLKSLSAKLVMINGCMYRPSISTADWNKVYEELLESEKMSTVTIELDGQPIEFEITYYSPALPATRWEPAEPEELEWQAVDPAVQALIMHFGLEESIEELIREQAERDAEDVSDFFQWRDLSD